METTQAHNGPTCPRPTGEVRGFCPQKPTIQASAPGLPGASLTGQSVSLDHSQGGQVTSPHQHQKWEVCLQALEDGGLSLPHSSGTPTPTPGRGPGPPAPQDNRCLLSVSRVTTSTSPPASPRGTWGFSLLRLTPRCPEAWGEGIHLSPYLKLQGQPCLFCQWPQGGCRRPASHCLRRGREGDPHSHILVCPRWQVSLPALL